VIEFYGGAVNKNGFCNSRAPAVSKQTILMSTSVYCTNFTQWRLAVTLALRKPAPRYRISLERCRVLFTHKLREPDQRVPDFERDTSLKNRWKRRETRARVQLASSRRWSAVRATRTNMRESFVLRFVSLFPGDEKKKESRKDGNGNGEKKKKKKKKKKKQEKKRKEV
jgi:hypothetical protein